MSIKYELSLWREYPGSTAIEEEKVCIIAATGMDYAGRAQNIELKKEYSGKQTLTFEIPIKYFDIIEGVDKPNSFVDKVLDHSKLKLWRDERWWNPFASNKGVDEDSGCTIFEGAWEQGRWYEFIVTQRTQKRSKKKLTYNYSCDSLFITELSRNGYNLEFVPDTDIMSANGMGTAHELAKRIVDGTDWHYIKTEVFPDYKEEYNAVTGETVRTPVSTDQIEFVSGLEKYVYCYTLRVDDSDRQEEIKNEIDKIALEKGISLTSEVDYGFDETGTFYWKPQSNSEYKKHIYGYNKTNIITNYADKILCYTNGLITTGDYEKDENGEYIEDEWGGRHFDKVPEATLLNSTTLWEEMNGAILINVMEDGNGNNKVHYNYQIRNPIATPSVKNPKPLIVNSGYSDRVLDKGEHIVFNINTKIFNENKSASYAAKPVLMIYDGNPANNDTLSPAAVFAMDNVDDSIFCFKNSYILTMPSRVERPYIALGYMNTTSHKIKSTDCIEIYGLFIYKFVGGTEEWDKNIKEWVAAQPTYVNQLKSIPTAYYPSGTTISTNILVHEGVTYGGFDLNRCTINNVEYPIWVPVGEIVQNDFENGLDVFCLEFSRKDGNYDIYLPIEIDEVTKLTSYNTDKRRAIGGSKSNRFSLLETVSKTFSCFTRFMVEHDSRGYIKKDENDRYKKYFTYVSELGKRNFNGFTYGVNLEGVERKIESHELVTKVHVESIDNQYDDSGMVTIQNSNYNELGEAFFYNFSYFARQGFFNNTEFINDYLDVVSYVSRVNAEAKVKNAEYISKEAYRQRIQTSYDTHSLQLSSLKKTANEELEYIKWDRYIKSVYDVLTLTIPSDVEIQKLSTFPTIGFSYLTMTYNNVPVNQILDRETFYSESEWNKLTSYEKIAAYMYYVHIQDYVGYDQAEAWVGNGESEETLLSSLLTIDSCQTKYGVVNASVINEKIKLTKATQEVNDILEIYNQLLKDKKQKLDWFEKKYHRFILEGTWSGQDYISADTYYLDATRAMSTSCMPKVSYSMNVIDLSNLANPCNPEDIEWGRDFTFEVGDTTYIKDQELFGTLEQKAMISDITCHIDSLKPDSITLKNFETRFEELFQSIAAAVTSLQLNENIYSRAENFTADGTIDSSILQKSFDENKNLAFSSANNKVTQDNQGITIRTEDDSGQLLRAIAGGIFLSKDNGKTFTAGLTAEGFNANLITTGQLDTSKIVIRSNETPQYTLDSLGLTAYSVSQSKTNTQLRDNSIIRFDQFGIYAADNGRLFNRGWWHEQYREDYEWLDPKEKQYSFDYTGEDDFRKGAPSQKWLQAYNEINAIFGKWEYAFYIAQDGEISHIDDFSYYIREEINDGYIHDWGDKCVWYVGDNWPFNYGIKSSTVLTSQGWFGIITDISNTGYEEATSGPQWRCNSSPIKVVYYSGKRNVSYSNAERYIEQNSIFALTRKGLCINSGSRSNSTHKGSIKISTEVPNLMVYGRNEFNTSDQLRVKLGYIRTDEADNNKQIHGLDIYNGAVRFYGCEYRPDLKDEEASIYFKRDDKDGQIKMYINSEIKRVSKFGTINYATTVGYDSSDYAYWSGKFSRNGVFFDKNDEQDLTTAQGQGMFLGHLHSKSGVDYGFNTALISKSTAEIGLLISNCGTHTSASLGHIGSILRIDSCARPGQRFSVTQPMIELQQTLAEERDDVGTGIISIGFPAYTFMKFINKESYGSLVEQTIDIDATVTLTHGTEQQAVWGYRRNPNEERKYQIITGLSYYNGYLYFRTLDGTSYRLTSGTTGA